MLASAVAAGWYGGPTGGALVGFTSGLFYDFYLATPLGLNALTYAIVGYLLGQIAVFLSDEAEWIIRITISVAAVTIGLVLIRDIRRTYSRTEFIQSEFWQNTCYFKPIYRVTDGSNSFNDGLVVWG